MQGPYTGMDRFLGTNYLAEVVKIKLTQSLGNPLLERTPSEKKCPRCYAVALKRSHALRFFIAAKTTRKEKPPLCADIFSLTPSSSITI